MAENTIISEFSDLSRQISEIRIFDSERADDFSKKLNQFKTLYSSGSSNDSEIIQLLVKLRFEIDEYINRPTLGLTLDPEAPNPESGAFKKLQNQKSNASDFVAKVYANLSTSNLDIETIKQFKSEMENVKERCKSSEKNSILFFYNEIIAKLVLAYQMIYFLDNDEIPTINISEFCDIGTYIAVCSERLSEQMKKNQADISPEDKRTITNLFLLKKKDLQINQLLSSNIFGVLTLGESRIVDRSAKTKPTKKEQNKPVKPQANEGLPTAKEVEETPQALVPYNYKTSLHQKAINLLYKRFPKLETVTLIFKKEHMSPYSKTYLINSQNFELPVLSRRKKLSIVGCIFSDNITELRVKYKMNGKQPYWGEGPFYGCNNLEKVHLPANLKEIPNFFLCCTKIKELTLPKKIKRIGVSAFRNCDSLKEITNLNETCIEEIGQGAFRGCDLTHVEFPSTIMYIGYRAFAKNEHLTSVNFSMNSYVDITKKLGALGYSRYTFEDCPKLSKIDFIDDGCIYTYIGEKGTYPVISPELTDQTVTLALERL